MKAVAVAVGLASAAVATGFFGVRLSNQPTSSAAAQAPVPITRDSTFVAPRPYTVSPDQLPEWRKVSTVLERNLIEDGVLTFEEYESAVFVTIQCIEDLGITVVHSSGYGRSQEMIEGARLSKRGVYSYTGRIYSPDGTRPTSQLDAINDCRINSAQVEFMWAQHTAPGEIELQALRDHMAGCLRAKGAAITDRPSDDDLRKAIGTVPPDAYRDCQFAAADASELDRVPG